jgi:hypothetical protein
MRSKILIAVVAVCFAAGVTEPLRAQGAKRISRTASRSAGMAGLAPTAAERDPSGQYAPQDLEELRTQLLNLADTVEQFAPLAPPDLVDLDSLREAKAQIQQMSAQQLNTLRQGISPSKITSRIQRAQQEIETYKTTTRVEKKASSPKFVDPNPIPVVSALCSGSGPNRIPVGVILAADIVFFIADSVRELAQDACKQDVLGENTSLACIAVDVVWIAAKAVDEGIHFCDDDLTGNVIDTSYDRLEDVHTDLFSVGTGVDTHLTTVNTDIDTRIASLDTHLTNVDTHIQNEFATLTSLVTTLIANLSAQLTAAENKLVDADFQIMKLDLTPDGLRQIVGAILTCDGTASKPCPNVLSMCPLGKCSWNDVGPLP